MHCLGKGEHKFIGIDNFTGIESAARGDLLLWPWADNVFVLLPYGRFDAALIYNTPDIKSHTVLIDRKVFIENYQFNSL